MQAEAERSPETRAKEVFVLFWRFSVLEWSHRDVPCLQQEFPNSRSWYNLRISGICDICDRSHPQLLENCRKNDISDQNGEPQTCRRSFKCSVWWQGDIASCQEQQEGIKTNTDDPKKNQPEGLFHLLEALAQVPSLKWAQKLKRCPWKHSRLGWMGLGVIWEGRFGLTEKGFTELLPPPGSISFFCLVFVICSCISLLLCCQDLLSNYTQTAAGRAHHCQQQCRKTRVIKINNNLPGTRDTVNQQWNSDLKAALLGLGSWRKQFHIIVCSCLDFNYIHVETAFVILWALLLKAWMWDNHKKREAVSESIYPSSY